MPISWEPRASRNALNMVCQCAPVLSMARRDFSAPSRAFRDITQWLRLCLRHTSALSLRLSNAPRGGRNAALSHNGSKRGYASASHAAVRLPAIRAYRGHLPSVRSAGSQRMN
jgi:hypothetical protein